MWNGWLVGQPAGSALPLCRSVENRPTLFFSLSLPLLCITLCACTRVCARTVFWKMRGLRVCAFRRKKKKRQKGGDAACSRGAGRFPQRRNFSTRAPKRPWRGGWGTKFSFRLFFLFFVGWRFAFFGRANVILIARLSALLCEFARHFFHLVPREIADAVEGKKTSSSFSSTLLSRAKRKFSSSLPICSPFCVDSTLLLVYRRRLFLGEGLFHYRCTRAGNGRQARSSQRWIRSSIRIYIYIHIAAPVYTYTGLQSNQRYETCVRRYDVTHAACC